ncbi:hypothetical protein [Chitinophaga sp.]|uniref:hypothetical protein n=1 Tax=Chitinophaga sp. TaxID=1869181 RepID=UPI0031E10BCE
MSQELRDAHGRFLQGNQFSRKTPEEMDILVENYCAHRALGLDKESFTECDYRTIEKNATDLQTEKIREANAKGWAVWENILRLVTLGQNVRLPDGTTIIAADCNPTLLIFTIKSKMRSVYGEKVEQAIKVEEPDTIDYSKLSDGALQEIINASGKG